MVFLFLGVFMGRVEKFIEFVREWCEDNSHGYNQSNRWGPDCDCSSLMYMSANAAGYDVPTGVGYTGTMIRDFTLAGWSAVPFDGNLYDCEPGCIALNVENHTEAFVDWGTFGGAHIDEHGCISGGTPGDQTGNEVSICPAYVYSEGWDYILIPPEINGGSEYEHISSSLTEPRYRVFTKESGWLSWMEGLKDTGGSSDDYAGVEGCWIYDIQFENLGSNGWYTIERADGSCSKNSSGNTESPVTGIIVYYDTDTSKTNGEYYVARYQAHWQGNCPGWGAWETDDIDTGNGAGAGKDCNSPLDMIRIKIERA